MAKGFDRRFVLNVSQVHTYGEGKDYGWVRCFQGPDATIHLSGGNKTADGGRTIVPDDDLWWDDILRLNRPPAASSIVCRSGFFLGLGMDIDYTALGVYHGTAWRSMDDLQTVEKIPVVVNVPDGPRRKRQEGEWFGLYFWRSILEMPDGSLLATVEGNFDSDRVKPTGRRDQHEIPSKDSYKLRTVVVRSIDGGATWDYLSTVAAPQPDDDAVGEGFAEPTLVQLDDGRLLCVMRSGNYTPLYSAWSTNEGKSWTGPVYTGLERGLDPCLLRLRDGRILLSYGMRYPAGSPGGPGQLDTGAGLVKLAISADATGTHWVETTIGQGMRSSYSTIIEVEPNLIFCQVDGCCWRVLLMPKVPDTL